MTVSVLKSQFLFRTGWSVSRNLPHRLGVFTKNSIYRGGLAAHHRHAMATSVPNSKPMNPTDSENAQNRKKKKQDKRGRPLKHLKYIQKKGGEASLPPPGLIEMSVIGTGAAGTPRSAFLDLTHFRYLFNCGEGTQRAAMEHKMRLSKLKNIFVTYKSWENIGGLLGMGLSLGSIGLPDINIHGPPNVEKILTMSKGFSPLFLKVYKREISEGPYEDSAMKIDFIPIVPKGASEQLTEDAEPASKRPRPDENNMAIVYYCQPIPKTRGIDFNKAVALGLPRGPIIGQLKAGETVTLDDGRQITPDQVLCDPEDAYPFIVIEVPTLAHLEQFTETEILQRLPDKPEKEAPQLIVHFTPPEILSRPEYQQWMNRLPSQTRHLILNSSGSAVTQLAPYELQAQFNLIHPDIFPLLPHQDTETESLPELKPGQRVFLGKTGLKVLLREGSNTKRGFYTDGCIEVNNSEFTAEVEANKEFEKALAVTKENLKNASIDGGSKYPEIVFLGTGSAIPNKTRNVSAILVHTSQEQSVFLDCGEGTYGQLCHHYGKQSPAVLRRITAVFLSHLHPDHHMGLIGLIEGREKAFDLVGEVAPPITLIVAGVFKKFLEQTDIDIACVMSKIRFVPVELFYYNNDNEHPKRQQVLDDLCFKQMTFAQMRHPQFPYGIAITHKDGWKMAYSGDTMPCDAFVEIGKDSDVLIHEASMEDELIEDAREKKHSTTSQAIEVGIKMAAKFILLTHFSQRYAKIPRFNSSFNDKVGIAFDNMRVRLNQLPLLPLLLPALQELFSEELGDLEKKTEQRLLNKESKKLLEQQKEKEHQEIATKEEAKLKMEVKQEET